MFELEELALPGAMVIHGKNFRDERGEFHKSVHRASFEKLGLEWRFDEQFYTISGRDVIRGMHIQTPPHDHIKMVYCAHGQVLDVMVDLRRASPTYGRTCSISLDHDSAKAVYIPVGVAHGFRSLSERSIMMYSVTAAHAPSADTGVRWDSLDFDWGIDKPVISARDAGLVPLNEFESPF